MQIRKAEQDDFDDTVSIEQKVLYPELSIQELESWIESEDNFEATIFVAEKAGKIVGSASYEIYEVKGSEIIITLDTLVIDKKNQGQGVGKQLLLTSLREAVKFYQKAGRFKVIGLFIQTDPEVAGFYEKVFPAEKLQKKDFSSVWKSGEGIILLFVPV